MFSSRTKLACFIVLLAAIYWRSGRLLRNVIFTKHAFPAGYYADGTFASDCITLKASELKYCEDASLWELRDANGALQDRRLLVSCDAGRKAWNTVMGPLHEPAPYGSLWLYEPGANAGDWDAGKLHRLQLKGFPEGHDFHPLGLAAWPSYAGNASNLYVVNHARERTVVEQFVISPAAPDVATHVRTLTSPYFVSPNAVALTSPDSFYVSNDHLVTRRWPYIGHVFPVIESILGLPLAFVSHITLSPPYSNSASPIEAHQFATAFLPFPNGVAVSPSGKHVAVASTTLGQILIYERDPHTNALSQVLERVYTPFTPDNLHFTHDGAKLLVAGHPNFPALTAVAANKTGVLAPSWVLEIRMDGPNGHNTGAEPSDKLDAEAPISAGDLVPRVQGHELRTLFQSDGSGFSSSTTAVLDPFTNALFVAGLYAEEGVMMCRPRRSR